MPRLPQSSTAPVVRIQMLRIPGQATPMAVYVHGIFTTFELAQQFMRKMLQGDDSADRFGACIIDCTDRWLPVWVPAVLSQRGTMETMAREFEEVVAKENKQTESVGEGGDTAHAGSVCELPGRSTTMGGGASQPMEDELGNTVLPTQVPAKTVGSSTEDGETQRAREAIIPNAATRKRVYRDQRAQLDALLEGDLPITKDMDTYEQLRSMHALLIAFRRKVTKLETEATVGLGKAVTGVRQLERDHPDYTDRYMARYREALAQSGIAPDKVAMFQYLSLDDA